MVRPDTLINPADYPLDKILFDAEECMRRNPQRFEFLQLTSILHMDLENNLIVGHRHIGDDEFWMRGHLPGRPLFPGVLMIECMAQMASPRIPYFKWEGQMMTAAGEPVCQATITGAAF